MRPEVGGVAAKALKLPRGRRAGRWNAVAITLAGVLIALLILRPAATPSSAQVAPDFRLPLIWGGHGTLSLGALRGHPVLINFLQSDCGPCLDEMPLLAQTARTYKAHGVIVVGISSLGDPASAARRLAAADHLPFPVVSDTHQAVAWQYGVSATPTTMFVDARGNLQGQYVGQLDAQTVRDGLAQSSAIACGSCSPVERPILGADAPADAAESNIRANDVFEPPFKPGASYALRDQRGQLITPAALRGKVVALTFISAACVEQCPLVGQTLSQARRLLGRDGARFSIVAISVAPEQDSPQTTRRFARKAGWEGTDWHYLTGPRAALQRIWKAYGIDVEAPSPIFKSTGTGLVHQAGLYLVDPLGRLRAYDGVPFLASDVAASVRAMLASSSSPY